MTLNDLDRLCSPSSFDSRSESEMKSMVRRLVAVAKAARSLMAEDGAKEALAHYSCLHILAEKVDALDGEP